jgi:hypothetical protein
MRMVSPGMAAMSLIKGIITDSMGRGWVEWSKVREFAPTPDCMVLKAAIIYSQNLIGSFSDSSRESHAVGIRGLFV